jgi:uncharacterized protein YdhG (YjbR/CyaY superfamily)
MDKYKDDLRSGMKNVPRGGSPDSSAGGPKAVDGYLAALPKDRRAALGRLRRIIRSEAPGASETISYHMPIFKHHGMLVGFASFKEHLTFFVMSTRTMKAHRAELNTYETTAGGIHFTPAKPLPVALVRKLVRERVKENGERDQKRRKKRGR